VTPAPAFLILLFAPYLHSSPPVSFVHSSQTDRVGDKPPAFERLRRVYIHGSMHGLVLQTGFYTVVVGDSNGCVNSTTLYVEITGVEDLFSDKNISIYPNPSSGNFIFEWTTGHIAGYINIHILNTIGEVVFSSEELLSPGNFQTVRKEIELTNVPNGFYFIELSKYSSENITGCLQATRKLMIAK